MRYSTRTVLGLALVLLLAVGAVGQEREEAARKRERAEQLYTLGYLLTLRGRFDDAIELYERSLALHPTAEAQTFLGWTYSHMGDYERAMAEAKKAIPLDPDFGNPYNDIGVYLIELGREDEAIPYLQKAMRAKRYCCYQFPHFNLGRIYLKKKMYEQAREEFQRALQIDPDYAPALKGLELLRELRDRQI
jgi:tetratricopeptide (TPR) repeat protein